MFTQHLFTSRKNNEDGSSTVGQEGRLWYDSTTNTIRLGNGTPGGIIISGGGSSSATTTRIDQITPASTWILSHTLNRIPVVTVYLVTDEIVITDVAVTINTITVTFPSPQSGYVLII